MKKYGVIVLILTSLTLLLMLGRFCVRQGSDTRWQVEVEREDVPAASVSEEHDRPDSLLEGEVININTASAADLQRLPGIGAERAAAIVAEREERGVFAKPENLTRVDGIGEKTLERLLPYITTGEN